MKKPFQIGLLFTAFCLFLGLAQADDTTTETRAIDARVVRVKLDGVIDLKLRRGDTPALNITTDKRYVNKVTAVQTGDTLYLDTESRGVKLKSAAVKVELVLPQLRELVSEGVGSTEVSGFSGENIDLTLDGAGSMKVVCDYKKLKANLGGVGSMHVWVTENENVDLDLQGAGYITIGGRSKNLKATLGGGWPECAAVQGGRREPGLERLGQRDHQRVQQRQPEFERTGFRHCVRQADYPQRERGWPGQGELEVRDILQCIKRDKSKAP